MVKSKDDFQNSLSDIWLMPMLFKKFGWGTYKINPLSLKVTCCFVFMEYERPQWFCNHWRIDRWYINHLKFYKLDESSSGERVCNYSAMPLNGFNVVKPGAIVTSTCQAADSLRIFNQVLPVYLHSAFAGNMLRFESEFDDSTRF